MFRKDHHLEERVEKLEHEVKVLRKEVEELEHPQKNRDVRWKIGNSD